MSKYIVEYHIRKLKDKRGERGQAIIKDGGNGEKLYSSEKYKNWKFGQKRSYRTSCDLQGSKFVIVDHRKK
jgi:hypothetical protein